MRNSVKGRPAERHYIMVVLAVRMELVYTCLKEKNTTTPYDPVTESLIYTGSCKEQYLAMLLVQAPVNFKQTNAQIN